MKKVILILSIISLFNNILWSQNRVEKKLLINGKTEVKIYDQDGGIYQQYFELEGKKDSVFLQWFKNGVKEKQYFYKKGVKSGKWLRWYDSSHIKYRERVYLEGFLTQQKVYTLKKNGKLSSLEEKYIKGDSTIEKETVWHYGVNKVNSIHISKDFKDKPVTSFAKSWNEEGLPISERIVSYGRNKENIIFNKIWESNGKLEKETWIQSWYKHQGEALVRKEKLLRRKTYKDGKLIKDEKFE